MKREICMSTIAFLIVSIVSCGYMPVIHGNGVPYLDVFVDIKPGSWPNPINIKSKGVFAVAVCGTADFDVARVDPTTIKIYVHGIEEGVSPIRWSYEDVATPYIGPDGGGHDLGGDGYMDLVFHFETRTVVTTLNLYEHTGETVFLFIKGNLKPEFGGKAIMGGDYVWVIDLPGDVNSDASVNILDAVIISLAWGSTLNPGLNWDSRADVNDDNEVNILDAAVVALHWGETP